MRLHLVVCEPPELGLQVPQVVNGPPAVRGSDDFLWRLSQLQRNARPRRLDGLNTIYECTIHLCEGD